VKYGKISNEALRDAIQHSSAEDIDIRRMADEIASTRDRTDELCAWASNRIACCRSALTGRNGDLSLFQVKRYEQEQATLEAVLRLLNGEPTP